MCKFSEARIFVRCSLGTTVLGVGFIAQNQCSSPLRGKDSDSCAFFPLLGGKQLEQFEQKTPPREKGYSLPPQPSPHVCSLVQLFFK